MNTENAQERVRPLWFRLAVFGFLLSVVLIILYAVMDHAGGRDLQMALAETDHLDPQWRTEGLDARRSLMPPANENGYEQIMAAARALPSSSWPRPTFPQFDKDPVYQEAVVREMEFRLSWNYDPM